MISGKSEEHEACHKNCALMEDPQLRRNFGKKAREKVTRTTEQAHQSKRFINQ
jgi:hypothetical protein